MVIALASHLCSPGSVPGLETICGMLLVFFSAPRRFPLGSPVFSSP